MNRKEIMEEISLYQTPLLSCAITFFLTIHYLSIPHNHYVLNKSLKKSNSLMNVLNHTYYLSICDTICFAKSILPSAVKKYL